MAKFPLPSSVGRIYRASGGSQTAGAEVSDTVPVGKSWWLMDVCIPLVKGGTGTPQPALQIVDQAGTQVGAWIGSSAVQAVNTTCTYTWSPNTPLSGQIGSGVNVFSSAPIPELVLPAGYGIKTVTVGGVGATTSFGTPSYFVCELG